MSMCAGDAGGSGGGMCACDAGGSGGGGDGARSARNAAVRAEPDGERVGASGEPDERLPGDRGDRGDFGAASKPDGSGSGSSKSGGR
jgi:hypothetical protein